MSENKNSKHMKSFWPLFGLIVVSMVLGGIIYAVAFGNMLQDDLNSMSFGAHRLGPPKEQTKQPVKTAPKSIAQ